MGDLWAPLRERSLVVSVSFRRTENGGFAGAQLRTEPWSELTGAPELDWADGDKEEPGVIEADPKNNAQEPLLCTSVLEESTS